MNQAHLHLMIVHIPIILVPMALILYLIGYRWSSKPLKLVALNTFVLASVFAGFAYLLGEGAEEIVEDMAGIAESVIESHEESATIALWLTIVLGFASIANLLSLKYKTEIARILVIPIILLGAVSSGALAYTAQEGGRIRHSEAFEQNVSDKKSTGNTSDAQGHSTR